MDYNTLIAKYLGARTPQQLANDIKNLQAFEARGGDPSTLLQATRAKIFNQSSTTAQKGLETLQQQPTPSPYASSINALKGFEQELGVPQAETAFETAQQQFQKLQREQQLAPGVSRTIFKEKVPLFAESMEDMVSEYTNPDSPNYIQNVGTIAKLVSSRLDNQQAALGDMLSMVNSIYSASTQAAQTATELRGKRLDSLRKTAWDLYNEFSSLDKEITKEQRDLQTFAQKEGIRVQSEAKIAEARESAEARYRAPSGAEGKEDLSEYQKITVRNQIEDNLRMNPSVSAFGQLVNFGVPVILEQFKSGGSDSVSDTVLMRALAKVTDPQTGVREEEYRTFEDSVGALNQVYVMPKKWKGKGRLTSDGRAAMIREIQNRYNSREKDYNEQYKYYKKQAQDTGLDIPPPYLITSQAGETPRLKAPDGSIYEYDSTNDSDYQEDLSKGFTPI